MRSKHTPLYPTVSLFNLDDDPQESRNLAEIYPEMVESLLDEAEAVVAHAPPQLRGNIVVKGSTKSPDANSWQSFLLTPGTNFKNVVPIYPYLSDDQDLTKLEFEEGFLAGNWAMRGIVLKMVLVTIVLPLLILYKLVRFIRT